MIHPHVAAVIHTLMSAVVQSPRCGVFSVTGVASRSYGRMSGVVSMRGYCWGHVPGMAIVTRRSRRCMATKVAVSHCTVLGSLRAVTCGLSSRGRRHRVTHRRVIRMCRVTHGHVSAGLRG